MGDPIGTKVRLRTQEYVVPSLCLDEVERFAKDGTLERVPANGLTVVAQPDSRDAAIAVLWSALRWNYPEITREDVARELDLENTERAMAAVFGTLRLRPQKETDAGEAKP